jgi:WD40 repeat protein
MGKQDKVIDFLFLFFVLFPTPFFLSAIIAEMMLTEHTRAVNRVSWHPENANSFLTGSQDGTMKLWVCRTLQ